MKAPISSPDKIFNPFENRDPKEVWQEVRKQAAENAPISREEAMRRIEELRRNKKNNE